MPKFDPYRSEAEIEEVVRRFESCEYQPEEFVHAKHLTVTAWYFLHLGAEAAKEQMRAGLQKFIRHHGKNAYHVTITEFWLRLVNKHLQEAQPSEELVSRINNLIELLNNKCLIHNYYTREQLDTPEARATCLKPGLKDSPSVVR